MRWLCFFFAVTLFADPLPFGVTYEFSGGRLGDNLLSYLHAKWFAYQRGTKLYYKPFQYSSKFAFHRKEPSFFNLTTEPRIRHYVGRGPVNPNISLPILYVCPYAPEDRWELNYTRDYYGHTWIDYQVDWEDPGFKKEIQEMFEPNDSFDLIYPPSDMLSLALHVREGGGYDDRFDLDKGLVTFPLKFPPFSFYIEGILKMIDLFPGKKIYCHLFTDAVAPALLVQKIIDSLPRDAPIEFHCRKRSNRHHLHVVEDFFSQKNFDLLIRSQSNFSMVASLVHDFAAVFSPVDCRIEGDRVVITETKFKVNQELCKQRMLGVE